MMTLNPTDLFEKCIIKTNSKPKVKEEECVKHDPEPKEEVENITLTALTVNEVLEQDPPILEEEVKKEEGSNDLGLNDI
jgi:hypothetical protein